MERYVCNNIAEVKSATENLSVARKVPLFLDDNGKYLEAKNHKGIINDKSKEFCAVVTNEYNLVDHKEYIDTFAKTLSNIGIKYSMEIIEFNNRVVADITFENKNIKFDKLNEEFTTGIRLQNSYNKTTGVSISPKYTRLACNNGMVITRDGNVLNIKHNQKVVKNINSMIEKKVYEIINQDKKLQNWVSSCMDDTIEWETVCMILEKMFNQPKHLEPILKNLNIDLLMIKDIKNKDKTIFSYVWRDEKLKKDKISRWDVYNAITQYISHGESITPHVDALFQGKAEKVLLNKFEKLPKIERKI